MKHRFMNGTKLNLDAMSKDELFTLAEMIGGNMDLAERDLSRVQAEIARRCSRQPLNPAS
jgi:hypothetical protein